MSPWFAGVVYGLVFGVAVGATAAWLVASASKWWRR
jgi:hypothetical protein